MFLTQKLNRSKTKSESRRTTKKRAKDVSKTKNHLNKEDSQTRKAMRS